MPRLLLITWLLQFTLVAHQVLGQPVKEPSPSIILTILMEQNAKIASLIQDVAELKRDYSHILQKVTTLSSYHMEAKVVENLKFNTTIATPVQERIQTTERILPLTIKMMSPTTQVTTATESTTKAAVETTATTEESTVLWPRDDTQPTTDPPVPTTTAEALLVLEMNSTASPISSARTARRRAPVLKTGPNTQDYLIRSFQGKEYVLVLKKPVWFDNSTKVTWNEAETACYELEIPSSPSAKYFLASVESEDEKDFLINFLETTGWDHAWVGAYINRTTDEKFRWVTPEDNFLLNTNKTVDEDLSGLNEPNNANDNEDCVEIGKLRNGLNDSKCMYEFNFICKEVGGGIESGEKITILDDDDLPLSPIIHYDEFEY